MQMALLKNVVRVDLIERIEIKDLKVVRKWDMRVSRARTFQAEGTVCEKALRWESGWCIWGSAGIQSGWSRASRVGVVGKEATEMLGVVEGSRSWGSYKLLSGLFLLLWGSGKLSLLKNSEDRATLDPSSSWATGGWNSTSAFSLPFVLHFAAISTPPYWISFCHVLFTYLRFLFGPCKHVRMWFLFCVSVSQRTASLGIDFLWVKT